MACKREELFKNQQDREMTYSKSSNTESYSKSSKRDGVVRERVREERKGERENIYIGIEVVKHGTRLEEEEEEAQDGQA